MTVDQYIEIFRDECREHLNWEEAQEYAAVFATRAPFEIIRAMEELRGKIPSPRFQRTLENFHYEFGR